MTNRLFQVASLIVGAFAVAVVVYAFFLKAGDEDAKPAPQSAAVDLLIKDVIHPERLGPDDEVVAFQLDASLPAGTKIAAYLPSPLPTGFDNVPCVGNEKTLDQPAWFFWIDDSASALFSHPTRYVLISNDAKKVQAISAQGWQPCINGQIVEEWTTDDGRATTANRAYSSPGSLQRARTDPPGPPSALANYLVAFAAASSLTNGEAAELAFTDGPPKAGIVAIDGWSDRQPGQKAIEGDTRRAGLFAQQNLLNGTTARIANGKPALDQIAAQIDKVAATGVNKVLLTFTAHGDIWATGESYVWVGGQPVGVTQLAGLLKKYATPTADRQQTVDFSVAVAACRSADFQRLSQIATNVEKVATCTASINDLCRETRDQSGAIWNQALMRALSSPENAELLKRCPSCALDQAAEAASREPRVTKFEPVYKNPDTGQYILRPGGSSWSSCTSNDCPDWAKTPPPGISIVGGGTGTTSGGTGSKNPPSPGGAGTDNAPSLGGPTGATVPGGASTPPTVPAGATAGSTPGNAATSSPIPTVAPPNVPTPRPTTVEPTVPTTAQYTGTLASTSPVTFTTARGECVWLVTFSARVALNVTFSGSTVNGSGNAVGSHTDTVNYQAPNAGCTGGTVPFNQSVRGLGGAPSAITWSAADDELIVTFNGSLIGNAIVGTVTVRSADASIVGGFSVGLTLTRSN